MKLLIILMLIAGNCFASLDQEHSQLTKILIEHVKRDGYQTLVNYKKLKKNKKSLDAYLKELQAVKVEEFKKFTEDQKLAYWINAYNAYTLDIVVRNLPVKSIKEISSGGFFSSVIDTGPWDLKFISLLGKKLSLNDIEHQTIRKDFDEPRIHFAVNCASIGCPSIIPEAFTASKLEAQLESAAKNFMSNTSKNSLKDGKLTVSKIFKWYGGDFDKRYGGYKKFVLGYFPKANKSTSFEFGDYDWNLNSFE